jgi:hypothetical protein
MAARSRSGNLPAQRAKEMSRMPKVSKDSAAHWGYVLEGRVVFRFTDREGVSPVRGRD